MNDGKQGPQVQHKWLWAISPLDAAHVAFVAHCRMCNKTFTKRLWVASNDAMFGHVALPEWGCVNPYGSL